MPKPVVMGWGRWGPSRGSFLLVYKAHSFHFSLISSYGAFVVSHKWNGMVILITLVTKHLQGTYFNGLWCHVTKLVVNQF